jgi:hypothetical protein
MALDNGGKGEDGNHESNEGDTAMTRRFAAGILIVLVGAATFYGVSRMAISQPAEPTSTPEPGLGLPKDMQYPVVGDLIDLSTPLPGPLEVPIAGYRFVIPKGASILDHIDESVPVDVGLRQTSWRGHSPSHYFLISRGKSLAKIDAETGEIFEWDVKAEDVEDFEPLKHPSRASDAPSP